MSAQPLLAENTILIDGLIIDIESGEVVGQERPEFRVTDEASAEWVLEKIMNAEADAARDRLKLKAVVERLEASIKASEKRAEWFRSRYGSELEEFARERLQDSKTKTLKLTWGSISFRTVKGGLRVADPEAALTWAKQYAPEAVKVTEAFQITKLGDDWRTTLTTVTPPEQLAERGFAIAEDSEVVSIKTGVTA